MCAREALYLAHTRSRETEHTKPVIPVIVVMAGKLTMTGLKLVLRHETPTMRVFALVRVRLDPRQANHANRPPGPGRSEELPFLVDYLGVGGHRTTVETRNGRTSARRVRRKWRAATL